MPLVRIPEPFDHPDWLYEIKHDGFRALAIIEGHRCRLVSRRGHTLARWDQVEDDAADRSKQIPSGFGHDRSYADWDPRGRSPVWANHVTNPEKGADHTR
jgi:hypothetical protein